MIRALILDDNTYMRILLRTMLHGLGIHDCREAADAAAAFELLQNQPVDVILVDHRLPDLTGAEFVSLLRRSPDSPNVYAPVIMVSAHADRTRIAEAREAGADEFLVKPVTAKALALRLTAVAEKRRRFYKAGSFVGPDRRRRTDPHFRGPFRRDEDRGAGVSR